MPPAYVRNFPLIARGADLPLDDSAERAEITLAITHALTQTVEGLEPMTVFDQDLNTVTPDGEGGSHRAGEPGAAGWRVKDLRTGARRLIRELRDPALLPLLVHALATAAEGRKGEFRDIQRLLVTASGNDSAPFFVVPTPANRRAAEAFWLDWWTHTRPRAFATEKQALSAGLRWHNTSQMRAWAADPPSWLELMQSPAIAALDSTTNEAVRGVVRTLLTDDPARVAGRMGTIPGRVVAARLRAALYVRLTQDTASVPALIAALTVPDPDLYLARHDSVFLTLQQTLVEISAAGTG